MEAEAAIKKEGAGQVKDRSWEIGGPGKPQPQPTIEEKTRQTTYQREDEAEAVVEGRGKE